jgi:hypothetical protein
MCKQTTLQDYYFELSAAYQWKAEGKETVSGGTAGPDLAAGRDQVPINEYIAFWHTGIDAMEAGADQTQYEF